MSKQRQDPNAVLVARESGTVEIDGESYVYVKGVTRARASHPIVKALPAEYFEPADEEVHYDVEQATAKPGEKRGGESR